GSRSNCRLHKHSSPDQAAFSGLANGVQVQASVVSIPIWTHEAQATYFSRQRRGGRRRWGHQSGRGAAPAPRGCALDIHAMYAILRVLRDATGIAAVVDAVAQRQQSTPSLVDR